MKSIKFDTRHCGANLGLNMNQSLTANLSFKKQAWYRDQHKKRTNIGTQNKDTVVEGVFDSIKNAM